MNSPCWRALHLEERSPTNFSTSFAESDRDLIAGCEWIVDATGCPGEILRSLESLQAVCDRVIRELGLQVVGVPLWRQFPEPGGVTGLFLLSESHLACHTWPEHGIATFNLFCCHRRREWPWKSRLKEMLAASSVDMQMVERGHVTRSLLPATSSSGDLP